MSDTPPYSLSPDPKRPRRHARRWLISAAVVLVLIGAVAAVLVGRNGEPAVLAPEDASPSLTVTAATSRLAEWPATLAASGVVAPWEEASIGTQIGSYQLVEVRVNVGDRVRRGQVLARLDPALLRAEEAQLLATFEQAQANRQRALALREAGAISEQETLQFVTEARTAEAALAGVRTRLRYTNVVAPDDGTISARSATLGSVVPAGQELFRLIRKDRLEWRGELTPAQLAQVRLGQEITLRLPAGGTALARVRQTAPSLNEASRLGVVYADIQSGSPARAGMFAEGDVVLGSTPALIVPAESVIIRDGRSRILVLADGSATPLVSLRSVSVGRRGDREVEITEGLRPGERVVVQGAGFLKDRDRVRVAQPTTTAGVRQQ
ncbi:efflux RND transporter periplasmic adaptor subunit [Brevundimonas sp. FT23042]|uniref:efflux RND transporter periplasmic adaptor subunit n=1 Tax=Brevundimonas sp. FT23042 TaxID=3393749 RepID=UPI003B5899BA